MTAETEESDKQARRKAVMAVLAHSEATEICRPSRGDHAAGA